MKEQRHPRKRAAFEPPLEPPRADPEMRRPTATSAGAVLVLLRALAGALWAVSVAFALPPWLQQIAGAASGDASASTDPDLAGLSDLGPATAIFLAFMGALFAVQVVLGIRILFGGNLSRVLVMLISVASISAGFLGWWQAGVEITLRTTLLTLSLDILVLLALSSRDAAAYARRPRGRRAHGSRTGAAR